jgi:hypothetical protein
MKSSTFSKAIENESEYHEASKTLSQKKRPPAVLRLLMNSFESYRQARKFGWSRPWNKYELINFQSFRIDVSSYPWFLQTAENLLRLEADNMSAAAGQFCTELLADEKLMGFIFVHEYTHNGQQYEGATLSLGRVNNKRYRDRIDIIVESPVVDGVSQGVQRSRIYIDPYRETDKKPLWQGESLADNNQYITEIFAALSHVSWLWVNDAAHIWSHWTSAYIDYFGERQWAMTRSYFFAIQPADCRIEIAIPANLNLTADSSAVLEEQ